MPTTANFSLEYPDDNSSVDIAGHFETLADDVDEAINTRLALTGGTLTGALVGTLTTDSSSSTTGAFKTAGGMGIAKALYVGTTLNVTGTTTLTGDLTISKASATARINATSGDSEVHIDRTAGNGAYVVARTGTSSRWRFGSDSDVESGSNVGSDFILGRFSDAGSYIDAPLTVYRSTGKVSIGSVGATAGLQLGAGGPRMMSGTGSPESVVTAPIGSIWFQSDSTVGVTHWKKASGAGNTGWVVMEGDTGSRNMAAVSLDNGWTVASSVFLLRRIGATVQVTVGVNKTSATADTFYTLPVGFRPAIHTYGTSSSATDDYANATFTPGGALAVSRTYMNVAAHYLAVTFVTGDPWPTSLPGSAA